MSSEKRIFIHFSCGFDLTRQNQKERKEKSKKGDDGGPLQQRKRSIYTDSPCTASALQVPSLRFPSAPSPVLPLTWHCYMWLHVMCDV